MTSPSSSYYSTSIALDFREQRTWPLTSPTTCYTSARRVDHATTTTSRERSAIHQYANHHPPTTLPSPSSSRNDARDATGTSIEGHDPSSKMQREDGPSRANPSLLSTEPCATLATETHSLTVQWPSPSQQSSGHPSPHILHQRYFFSNDSFGPITSIQEDPICIGCSALEQWHAMAFVPRPSTTDQSNTTPSTQQQYQGQHQQALSSSGEVDRGGSRDVGGSGGGGRGRANSSSAVVIPPTTASSSSSHVRVASTAISSDYVGSIAAASAAAAQVLEDGSSGDARQGSGGAPATSTTTAASGHPHHHHRRSGSWTSFQAVESTAAGTQDDATIATSNPLNPSFQGSWSGVSLLGPELQQMWQTQPQAELILTNTISNSDDNHHSHNPEEGGTDDWPSPLPHFNSCYSIKLDFRPLSPTVCRWHSQPQDENIPSDDRHPRIGIWVGSADDHKLRLYRPVANDSSIVAGTSDPPPLSTGWLELVDLDSTYETSFSFLSPVMALDTVEISNEDRCRYGLAVACQDGTIRLICYDMTSDYKLRNVQETSVIVDGPIVCVSWCPANGNSLSSSLRCVVGSLCGYVCEVVWSSPTASVSANTSLSSTDTTPAFEQALGGSTPSWSWSGPQLVAHGLWNHRLHCEDSVLAVHATYIAVNKDDGSPWRVLVAVGTHSGRCLVYGSTPILATTESRSASESYELLWQCQLPYSIHGVVLLGGIGETCHQLFVTTRRSVHMLEASCRFYSAQRANERLRTLFPATKTRGEEEEGDSTIPDDNTDVKKGDVDLTDAVARNPPDAETAKDPTSAVSAKNVTDGEEEPKTDDSSPALNDTRNDATEA